MNHKLDDMELIRIAVSFLAANLSDAVGELEKRLYERESVILIV